MADPIDVSLLSSDEAPVRRLGGFTARLATALCVGLSLYALYWVLFIVQPQVYRISFLLIAIVLSFLLFPFRKSLPSRRSGPQASGQIEDVRVVPLFDWVLIAAAIAAFSWPLIDFSAFIYRAADPKPVDLVFGAIAILLVLEATRRSVGAILPLTAVGFLIYAYAGPQFDRIGLPLLAHRGFDAGRLVGTLYMTLEGVFGVPLDVAATYIVLFTIYGAVLEYSGAGAFFINWAMAAMGRSHSGAGPGRTVTLAGFLLGTVSGSGVATTVMLGSVSWPLLKRAGYTPETAGGILSAAGIGALLSPPTLGAAAFLIAEFLQISYLQVLIMASIPTLLYYLSIFLMIEADSRRLGTRPARADAPRLGDLTRKYWYHFTSLAAIAVLMAVGLSAFRAVFWATVLAYGLSFVRRESALTPPRLIAALRAGGAGVLGVAATTATAGIVVGVVTLTGLGLKIAGIIVALAAGRLFLTVVYSAVAVWLLGLAVPVTASYIIAAVMVAPALIQAGVPAVAAHMFIFYYAVLSEVSPPTALSPFAAAAITGANPFRTMLITWKYTAPAFLVPFAFTLSAEGLGILFQGPAVHILSASATAALGVAAVAGGMGGWIRRRASSLERAGLVAAGLFLVYAGRWADVLGLSLGAVVLILHLSWQSTGNAGKTTS
jgi:TRAP transporter 4TM/12TM fusion protein